jgi:SAM-dependent methyltransferase
MSEMNETKEMNETQEKIRESVSRAYATAVSTEGASCCCGPVEQKGVAAKLAKYTPDELASLPADAVANSFGCGNPLAHVEIGEGEVVLDLGSGAGIDILLAAQRVGPTGRVIGIDMTDEMIERARANIAAAGLNHVEVRRGIIEELPVESSSVDWVISNCVINLSPQKERVFAEIARVLKPGGRMLVSDIVVESLPEAARNSPALYSSCVAGAISEAAYTAGLREAGLGDVEVRERIVYDKSQLETFVQSELPDQCCSLQRDLGGASVGELVGSMVGQVWSAKFFARKPAACCCC